MGQNTIQGKIGTLNYQYPEGQFYQNSSNPINVDSAYIYYNHALKSNNSGRLDLNCSKYLYAELSADLDIFYKGFPQIVKKETDFGRVVNTNITRVIRDQENAAPVLVESPMKNNDMLIQDSIKYLKRMDSINILRNSPEELIKIPVN